MFAAPCSAVRALTQEIQSNKILPDSERALCSSHQGEHTAKRYLKVHSLSLHVFPHRCFHPSARDPGSWAGSTQRWFLIPHESDHLILANSFHFLKEQQRKVLPDPFLNPCSPPVITYSEEYTSDSSLATQRMTLWLN